MEALPVELKLRLLEQAASVSACTLYDLAGTSTGFNAVFTLNEKSLLNRAFQTTLPTAGEAAIVISLATIPHLWPTDDWRGFLASYPSTPPRLHRDSFATVEIARNAIRMARKVVILKKGASMVASALFTSKGRDVSLQETDLEAIAWVSPLIILLLGWLVRRNAKLDVHDPDTCFAKTTLDYANEFDSRYIPVTTWLSGYLAELGKMVEFTEHNTSFATDCKLLIDTGAAVGELHCRVEEIGNLIVRLGSNLDVDIGKESKWPDMWKDTRNEEEIRNSEGSRMFAFADDECAFCGGRVEGDKDPTELRSKYTSANAWFWSYLKAQSAPVWALLLIGKV